MLDQQCSSIWLQIKLMGGIILDTVSDWWVLLGSILPQLPDPQYRNDGQNKHLAPKRKYTGCIGRNACIYYVDNKCSSDTYKNLQLKYEGVPAKILFFREKSISVEN